jgi:hypothetical protein
MTPNDPNEKPQIIPSTTPSLDESWFADGERISSPPPSSTRSQRTSSLPPAEPIGDREADDWFR